MCAARVLVKPSHINGILDRNNNRPEFPFLCNFRSGKAVWQFAVLLALVGLCADAGDQILGDRNVLQICFQVKRGRRIRVWVLVGIHGMLDMDFRRISLHPLLILIGKNKLDGRRLRSVLFLPNFVGELHKFSCLDGHRTGVAVFGTAFDFADREVYTVRTEYKVPFLVFIRIRIADNVYILAGHLCFVRLVRSSVRRFPDGVEGLFRSVGEQCDRILWLIHSNPVLFRSPAKEGVATIMFRFLVRDGEGVASGIALFRHRRRRI